VERGLLTSGQNLWTASTHLSMVLGDFLFVILMVNDRQQTVLSIPVARLPCQFRVDRSIRLVIFEQG